MMRKGRLLSKQSVCLLGSALIVVVTVFYSVWLVHPRTMSLLPQPILNGTVGRDVLLFTSTLQSSFNPMLAPEGSFTRSIADADGSWKKTEKNGALNMLENAARKGTDQNSFTSGHTAHNIDRSEGKRFPKTAEEAIDESSKRGTSTRKIQISDEKEHPLSAGKAIDKNSFASRNIQKSDLEMLPNNAEKIVEEKDSKVPKAKLQSSPEFPKHYLLHRYRGRLGNVLFQFAATYCIAILNNLTLVVADLAPLRDLRDPHVTVTKTSWTPSTPVKHHPPAMGCMFNSSLMNLEPTSVSYALEGFFQSWKYFEPCKAEVKRATRFKDSIVNKTVSIVADLRKKLPHRTLVGIHVRREDYLDPSRKIDGKKVAPPDYYLRAMTYFRSYFRNVTFVVVTSSPSWFRSNVSSAPDVFFLERSASPAVDMEMLSRLDHLIFSVGTFGWWAAYKNNGTVVGYKDFFVPQSTYGRKMKSSAENFFYPGWITL